MKAHLTCTGFSRFFRLSLLAKSVGREPQSQKFRKGAKAAGLFALTLLTLTQVSAVSKDFVLRGEETKRGSLLGKVVPSLLPKQGLAQIVPSNWWLINDPIGVTRTGTVMVGITMLVVWHRVKGRRRFSATWTGNQALPSTSGADASGNSRRGFTCADLRRINLFEGFDEPQLEAFSHYLEAVNCPQFGHLIRQGKRGEAMYLVLEGEVRALRMVEGREFLLGNITAGQWVGELAVLDRCPREADVIANTDSILLQLSSDAFERMHREAPLLANQFLLVLARNLAGRVRCMHKRFEDSLRFIRASGILNPGSESESRSKSFGPTQRPNGLRPSTKAGHFRPLATREWAAAI